MAGVTKTNIQLGDSLTATQNFTITAAAADGTMKLARGNAGATTQDVLTVDANGKPSFPQGPGAGNTNQSMVRVNTANLFGSTNTVIRRFSTTVTSQGGDITYADSATLGALFTINTNGVYAISYTDGYAGGPSPVGISLNSAQLTTSVASITAADRLAMSSASAGDFMETTSTTVYLPAGSLIRPHTTTGANNPTTPSQSQFTITRVA